METMTLTDGENECLRKTWSDHIKKDVKTSLAPLLHQGDYNLPEYLCNSEFSVDNFKRQLKTFLFAQY